MHFAVESFDGISRMTNETTEQDDLLMLNIFVLVRFCVCSWKIKFLFQESENFSVQSATIENDDDDFSIVYEFAMQNLLE